MRLSVCCVLLGLAVLQTSGKTTPGDSSDGASITAIGSSSSTTSITDTPRSGPKSSVTTSVQREPTCPSRTANYITHTLPQQCLRTGRVASNGTRIAAGPESSTVVAVDVEPTSSDHRNLTSASVSTASEATAQQSPVDASESVSPTTAPAAETESDSPLDTANFLSFEEWKLQNQAKAEQAAEQGGNAFVNGRQRPINNALDSLGEEGEIEIDFSGFGDGASAPRQQQAAYRTAEGAAAASAASTSPHSRSKDAGKTCKERTNYASFDCAATMLKQNPECKSASSVLVENKDSYMLNTCSASNKFFIVELCNDILVDTVVLANFEFFSSIFRHFRVSVSDRYPVKMDKWTDLGTYEARNTREVQAFLIEHPQIWARYLRIEFLSHYGSEYYCPVSLLRVHGTTMLEEIRPEEDHVPAEASSGSETMAAEAEVLTPVPQEPDASTDETEKTVSSIAPEKATGASSAAEAGETALPETTDAVGSVDPTQSPLPEDDHSLANETMHILPDANTTCESSSQETDNDVSSSNVSEPTRPHLDARKSTMKSSASEIVLSDDARSSTISSITSSSSPINTTSPPPTPEESAKAEVTQKVTNSTSSTISASSTNTTVAVASKQSESIVIVSASNTNSSRSAASSSTSISPSTSTTGPSPPQPSTQESFFKSISKRLSQLEANSTLSLQYIEEQSRILRDAFSKVEKRQISATTSFLTNLNDTVMTELRGFRQAYDQLWQSTVIELDAQREQYQREILAISTRLTLVADELVWQKRMGIVQSTLILLCLGLVLFVRGGGGGAGGGLEVPLMQQMMNRSQSMLSKDPRHARSEWDTSPPASPSPESRSPVSLFRKRLLWRAVTDPTAAAAVAAAGGLDSGTDSRPESKDGPLTPLRRRVDVKIEPPTPERGGVDDLGVDDGVDSAGEYDGDCAVLNEFD